MSNYFYIKKNFNFKDSILNESYYLFFQNMTQINGFRGFVGYGIRELSQNETNSYCYNQNEVKTFKQIQTQAIFTSDFRLRTYSSGCYYYDSETGKWCSDGMDIYEDTTIEQAHCLAKHLTSFAAGYVILPSKINFQYAFANSSFAKSLLAIFSLMLITFVYILFAIWSKYMDIREGKKMNLVWLKDNHLRDSYFYEIIFFTGDESNSATESRVNKIFYFQS